MKLKYILSAGLLALGYNFSIAQEDLRYCGATEKHLELLKQHPEIKQIDEALEKETEQYLQNLASSRQQGVVYTIPIVFHILHQGGNENISDAQIQDAVRILNEDFRKMNADTSSIVSAFKPIADDSEIEFKLAQKDPNGNCTNGIDRIYSIETTIGDDGSKLNPWPRNKYLNVWVVKTIQSGAAGYAYKPGSAAGMPSVDGIMILSSYIGSIGTGNYTRARALTHEIGHWLNLDHVWGGTNNPGVNCNGDDNVADTPPTIGWTTCNVNGSSCGSPLDNVQNFMEYAYCSNMFTTGQKNRMRAALTSSTAQRSSLITSTNLSATGTNGVDILCAAKFDANTNVVCEGGSVTFVDQSFNGPSSWSWNLPGATPSTITNNDTAVVTYNTPGTYSATLTVTNSSGTKSVTYPSYIKVYGNTAQYNSVYSESFENATTFGNDWQVLSQDSINKWKVVSNAAVTGSNSLRLLNTAGSGGQVDEIISPTFDFSAIGSPQTVSFKVAYAQRATATTDKLQVYVSSNCGQTWSQRYLKTGSQLSTTGSMVGGSFTPTASQWRTEQFTVSNYSAATKVLVKFTFTSVGGNNIYIEDINVNGPTGIEDMLAAKTEFNVYPNPADQQSTVSFNLAKKADVKLEVFDVIGRNVKNIASEELSAGEHTFNVSATSGVYFIRLTVDGETAVKRWIVN